MKTQSKAIETMVKTSQGATVKTVSEKPSLSGTEILDKVNEGGGFIVAYKKAEGTMTSCLEGLNKSIACLHNGGVRLVDGRSKDKQTLVIKTALMDSLEGLSKNYKQDIWEMYFKAVNSGKPLKGLNKSRNSDKGAKGQKNEGDIYNILVKLYNHSDFENTFSEDTQAEIVELLKANDNITE